MSQFIKSAKTAIASKVDQLRKAMEMELDGYDNRTCDVEANKLIDQIVSQDSKYHHNLAKLKVQELALIIEPIRDTSVAMSMAANGLMIAEKWIESNTPEKLKKAELEIKGLKNYFDNTPYDDNFKLGMKSQVTAIVNEAKELLERGNMPDYEIKTEYIKYAKDVNENLDKFSGSFGGIAGWPLV